MQSKATHKHLFPLFGAAMLLGAIAAMMAPVAQGPVAHVDEKSVSVKEPVVEKLQAPTVAAAARKLTRVDAAADAVAERFARDAQPIAFVERATGLFEASTTNYTALLSAEGGLQYFPKGSSAKPSSLTLKLTGIRRGDATIFDLTDKGGDEAKNETAVPKGAGLSFWRTATMEENYEPRGCGIEQSFIFESNPAGTGALQFECELATNGLYPMAPRADRSGGIQFLDDSGRVAARYGRVLVRDSAQSSIALEPKLYGSLISFEVPEAWLASAQFPIVVDPLVGTDFAVSPDNPNGVAAPTVSAGNNNFLVAWVDYANGLTTPIIVGSVISTTGKAVTPFGISNSVGIPIPFRFQRIQAAYDGSNWLLAWSDARQAGPGIRGAIVGSNGAVLNGTDFLIAATTGNVAEDPLVTYDGANFVVAWTSTPPGQSGGSQVYYTRVNSAGTAASSQVVKNLLSPSNQALEYLVSQRPSGDTLLIYNELLESPIQHRAVRIAPDGSVRDNVGGTSLFKEAQQQSGFGRPIGAVFNNNEWQILSSFDQTKDSSVFLHRMSTDGVVTPPQGTFAEIGNGPTGLQSSGVLIDSYSPAFAGTSEWLFLRNEKVSSTVYHLLGKRVTFAGVDMDPLLIQIDTSTQGIIRNGVAAQSGSVFLAAWLDGRNGASQPADARNVAAALVDAAIAGTAGTPLVAVAAASPTSGEPELTVAFDSTTSKGSYDTLSWDFGDGTTSNLPSPAHIYKSIGTYIARLKLTKGAYSVTDSVLITVGSGGSNDVATQVGTPLDTTPPIITGLFINTATVALDFKSLNDDRVTVTGLFDLTQLSNTLTGLVASVGIGGKSYVFNLDAKGQFKSDAGSVPTIGFGIDPVKGTFTFQLVAANIRSEMAALGATNETTSTSLSLNLPITISVDRLTATSTVGTVYKATKNVKGTANYVFLGTGSEVSGVFLITAFSAAEASATEHNFTIKGRLVKPGTYKPSAAGQFNIYVGNYSAPIQNGAIFDKKGVLTYTQTHIKNGLKKFSIDLNSGIFAIQLLRVPSNISLGGSGLPLAKSGTNVTLVDLNLSFAFDLQDNPRLTAGRYMYIQRKDSASKSWYLR